MSVLINNNSNRSACTSNKTLSDVLGYGLPSSISVCLANPKDDEVDDIRSRKGQFGWFTVGQSHIPLIYRGQDEQYCSVRMAEFLVLSSYLQYLQKDVLNCVNVKSYKMTRAEASLLNQINLVHCDGLFGKNQAVGDLLVAASDVTEFYNFLSVCSAKLSGREPPAEKFGYVIIDDESVVPYTISDGRKYVPTFYFEGELDEIKTYKLQGWDFSYMKFCCKMQGIKRDLLAAESCSVVDLDDIKMYFPTDSTFEDYWPKENLNMQRLITSIPDNGRNILGGGWTKVQPHK